MEKDNKQLVAIQKKVRQRFLFATFTLVLYGSFILCYTEAGQFLNQPLGDSHVSGALLFFIGLIVIFLTQEYLFLRLDKDKK